MKYILSLLIFLTSTLVVSQKKTLDHTAYNDWKKLSNSQISNNGKYITYAINPYKGDGYLYLFHKDSKRLDSVPRGYKPTFSENNTFLTFLISAGFDTLRNCELEKVKKDKWPKDTLAIFLFEKDTLIKIPNVKSYEIAKKSDWIHYTLNVNELKAEKTDTDSTSQDSITPIVKKWWQFNFFKKSSPEVVVKKEKKKKTTSDGKLYYALNPLTNTSFSYKNITEFQLSENGKYVALVSHTKKDKKSTYKLKVIEPAKNIVKLETKEKTAFGSIQFNYAENAIAYLSTSDTNKVKQFELRYGKIKNGRALLVLDTTSALLPVDKGVSEHRNLKFSKDDQSLFFGVADKVELPEKDTLLSSEKAVVDLWSYTDNRLQPQQLNELKRDKKHSDLYVYHVEKETIHPLSNDSLKVYLPNKVRSNYLFASNPIPYQASYQWDSPFREDHYRVAITDGKVELLHKGTGFGGQLSPKGNYYTYYNGEKREHILYNVKTKTSTCINCSRKDVKWEEDLNGMPQIADAIGIIGWLEEEQSILLKSEFDVWKYDLSNKKLSSLTKERGELANEKLRVFNLQRDSLFLDLDNIFILGTNQETHATTVYNVSLDTLYHTNHSLVYLKKADEGNSILLRASSVRDYPDLQLTDSTFKKVDQISNTNPQQSNYNWATVEKVKWTSYDGVELEGLLYKPEDFDEDKSYPMMVYYYELSTDRFHSHSAPKPTASIIYPIEYASAGYVVFIPNIRYREGHPAKSAYDCIMSGTDKVLKLYPNIDSQKMGLQGQSWGGYQTAQLITMTDRYAAAMAGAPVSNMFSAYGGIRWGSGYNRQFQYEKQQSRIGKTIWEAPELYYENSPLFHIPKIKTPLLIMSNDNDGAVPWYQGIEMFTGMKRLGKPCWMLNYNGDKHNLMKEANRMDLSIRMRQFFDYYLQDAPAPEWLIEGIPAIEKGKDYKLDLIEK